MLGVEVADNSELKVYSTIHGVMLEENAKTVTYGGFTW